MHVFIKGKIWYKNEFLINLVGPRTDVVGDVDYLTHRDPLTWYVYIGRSLCQALYALGVIGWCNRTGSHCPLSVWGRG